MPSLAFRFESASSPESSAVNERRTVAEVVRAVVRDGDGGASADFEHALLRIARAVRERRARDGDGCAVRGARDGRREAVEAQAVDARITGELEQGATVARKRREARVLGDDVDAVRDGHGVGAGRYRVAAVQEHDGLAGFGDADRAGECQERIVASAGRAVVAARSDVNPAARVAGAGCAAVASGVRARVTRERHASATRRFGIARFADRAPSRSAAAAAVGAAAARPAGRSAFARFTGDARLGSSAAAPGQARVRPARARQARRGRRRIVVMMGARGDDARSHPERDAESKTQVHRSSLALS